MIAAMRKLSSFTIFAAAMLAVLFFAGTAQAQSDANRYFPKVPSTSDSQVETVSYEDPAPEMPADPRITNRQPVRRANHQQPTPAQQTGRRTNIHYNNDGYTNGGSNYVAGASFQSNNPAGYQGGPRNTGTTNNANDSGNTGIGNFGLKQMFGPQASRSQPGNMRGGNAGGNRNVNNRNMSGSGNNRTAMNDGFSGDNLPAPNQPGSVMQTEPTMTIVPEQISTGTTSAGPTVTSDAVYLDGEPIAPGRQHMSGPGMMAPSDDVQFQGNFGPNRGPDGLLNPYCNNCGDGCDSCNSSNCGGCCDDCCDPCPYGRPWILAPIDFVLGGLWHCGPHHGACDPCAGWWWGQDLTLFAGVHNFKSNVDLGVNSNFGFQEGLNWSMPFWHAAGIGAQIGFQTMQSDFYDNNLTDEGRHQFFLTAGFYRRVQCESGWQYGVVYDWLHDEFYEDYDVGQVRGELSYLWNCRNEIGFMYAGGVKTGIAERNGQELRGTEYEVIDQYALYFRRQFDFGGEGRVFGGGANNLSESSGGAGIVGVDFRAPIANCWAFEGGFNYLMPEGSDENHSDASDETWNIALNLVWYPGCTAKGCSPYRPLFNVADNGSLMVGRHTGLQQ